VRVAIVSPYDLAAHGGVQDQVFRLAEWLCEDGHDAWVVGPGEAPPGAVSVGKAYPVPANGSRAPVALDPRVARAVRRAIEGADVVHVHEPGMPFVSIAAARLAEVPTVGTFHADPSRLWRMLYRRTGGLLRWVIRGLDVVTAVSPIAGGAVARLGPYRIVPNGIDTATFATGPVIPHRVMFLGRNEPRKGYDVLAAAWPRVRAAVPDAELVATVEGPATADGIFPVGRISEADKRRLLGEADVFCAPGRGGESFGIVLAEAMASGCAVVASALPAFTQVIGDAGALCGPGDPDGLADVLITLLEDDTRRDQLRERAAIRVQRFDRSAVLAGYLAAYHDARES
jgi:phosphatidylinositol alpha-mannosyltransferase